MKRAAAAPYFRMRRQLCVQIHRVSDAQKLLMEVSPLKINTSTDYALRLLMHLADKGRMVSSTELSKEIDISQRYLIQIVAKLRDSDIIGVTKGMSGGYTLLEDASRINIYDIIELMEGISVPGDERATDKDELTLDGAFILLKSYIETYLQSITLDMLIGKNTTKAPSLLVGKVGGHIASLKNNEE